MSEPPFPPTTGDVSRRLHGVINALTARIEAAKAAAKADEPDSQHAAAMRGKARGYQEAVDLIERLDKGLFIRGRRNYTDGANS